MENVCRKSALKSGPITLVNFGKSRKTANASKRLLKSIKETIEKIF